MRRRPLSRVLLQGLASTWCRGHAAPQAEVRCHHIAHSSTAAAPPTFMLPPSRSGEAHQWFVRGKKRAGFELAVEFKWRAELAGAVVTGTAK